MKKDNSLAADGEHPPSPATTTPDSKWTPRACSKCAWWVAKDDVPRNSQHIPDGFGECRLNAPSGMTMTISAAEGGKWAMVAMQFPPTADRDWCAEYLDKAHDPDMPF